MIRFFANIDKNTKQLLGWYRDDIHFTISNSEETYKDKILKDLDFSEEIFRRGVLEGTKHSKPSPETLERLEAIESTLEKMMDSFKDHSKRSEERIEEIVIEFKEGMKDVKAITEFLSNASFMKKFFIGTGGLIGFIGGTYLMFKTILYGQN